VDYPEDFKKACDDLIDNWEGTTYTETPGDAGGGTKFGISKRSYPLLDIAHLTRDDAVKIYYRDFWMKGGIDNVKPFPGDESGLAQLKAKIFNIGVLTGVNEARLLLIGCKSLEMYKQVLVRHFEAIVIKKPGDGKFLKGWERRALA